MAKMMDTIIEEIVTVLAKGFLKSRQKACIPQPVARSLSSPRRDLLFGPPRAFMSLLTPSCGPCAATSIVPLSAGRIGGFSSPTPGWRRRRVGSKEREDSSDGRVRNVSRLGPWRGQAS